MSTAPLDDRLGHLGSHQADRADGVVVARDYVINRVGVTVGVYQADDGNPELVGLGGGQFLAADVNNVDDLGQLGHLADAAQAGEQLVLLALPGEGFFLGKTPPLTGFFGSNKLLHMAYPLANSLEIGQHPAEPALVDIGHAAGLSLLLDGTFGLALGADKQDRPALGGYIAHEVVGLLEQTQRLVQVNDVDVVARMIDVRPHLGMPTAGGMAEVYARLQQVFHSR